MFFVFSVSHAFSRVRAYDTTVEKSYHIISVAHDEFGGAPTGACWIIGLNTTADGVDAKWEVQTELPVAKIT